LWTGTIKAFNNVSGNTPVSNELLARLTRVGRIVPCSGFLQKGMKIEVKYYKKTQLTDSKYIPADYAIIRSYN
jgi:hypothetical protein